MRAASSQEKEFKQYLREKNIPFKYQKRWLGYGAKRWRSDFFLPAYQTVIECKDFSNTKIEQDKYLSVKLERVYKDLYKLDELGECFGLEKTLYLKVDRGLLPLAFIRNMTAHKIFLMTDQQQLIPILQGIEIFRNNKERYVEEKLKLEQLEFEKKQEKHIFNDKELQLLWDWSHGASHTDLGLHPMQLHRILKRYVCASVEKRGALHEQSLRQYLPDKQEVEH